MLDSVHHRRHEELRELVAVQHVDQLSEGEVVRVQEHLRSCSECQQAADEYKLLSDYGRALPKSNTNGLAPEGLWNHEEQKTMLLARLHSQQEADPVRNVLSVQSVWSVASPVLRWSAAAIVLVAAGCLVGYRARVRMEQDATSVGLQTSALQTSTLSVPQAEQTLEMMKAELRQASEQVTRGERRAHELEGSLSRLELSRAELAAKLQESASTAARNSEAAQLAAKEKNELAGRLSQTEQLLRTVQEELQGVREQRSRDLVRVATADFELQQAAAELEEKNRAIVRQQQYLDSDRDIRELMGARQLYIADVVDIDRNGRNRQPFGRVFYTKGKSLIFYGFDLDQQPGVRNASVFQVWGQSDGRAQHPVDLGIFYLDSETNHRWVLKADNPELLAQLDAVFVTVEKNRQNRQPTGKPFLYTYLRKSEPNHP